ncbi:unnamed protein product, partial [Ilex paraguariensis]
IGKLFFGNDRTTEEFSKDHDELIGGNDNEDAKHEVDPAGINNENETNGTSHSTTQDMDVSTDTPLPKKQRRERL